MKRTTFITISGILLLAACRQQEPQSQLKEINEALEKANGIIEDNNRDAYFEMNSKLADPRTYDKALVWKPRAAVVERRATEVKELIDSLKNTLIKQSDSLKNTNNKIVERVLNADDRTGKLFEKLGLLKDSAAVVFDSKAYEDDRFGLIEGLRRDSTWFYKSTFQSNAGDYTKAGWLNKNFANCSPLMAILILNRMKANVISAENFLVTYCNHNIVDNFCGYDNFSGIASLNYSNVKPGDTIVVTAGMGAFSDMMYPRITIYGRKVNLNQRKLAKYIFKANEKPGEYTVPITIEYVDADGKRRTAGKDLTYTVTDIK